MKILSFFGLGAACILFGMTWCLSFSSCYSWDCDCSLDILNRDLYIITSLVFSCFFLIYCVIFLFKINELAQVQRQEKADRLLDSNLIETNYTIYQLPSVRLLTKIGVVMALALFPFCYAVTKIICEPISSCNQVCNDYSYDLDLYLMGYGSAGIYFIITTVVGLMKSYPSKY